MDGANRHFHQMKRRATPIPVAPPRIPTPMPPNNNNGPRSTTKDEDPSKNTSTSPPGQDIQQRLISKAPFRLLDNDVVKTAWINPRLISKIDLDMIKKTDYVPPYERNMNGHNPHHLRPSSCGRVHDREWETPTTTATTMAVNGRAKHGPLSSVPTTTSTGTSEQSGVVRRVRSKPGISANLRAKNNMPLDAAKSGGTRNMKSRLPQGTNRVARSGTPVAAKNAAGPTGNKNAIATLNPQALTAQAAAGPFGNPPPIVNHQVRGLTYHQQNVVCDSAGVFGVYAETKYVYAVNSVGNNLAQASAAAAFFARAKPISQISQMGNLPESRVTAFLPVFTHTGIDYAGPILIRDRKTKNPKYLKAYVCVFVCMATKCVHLDLVTDMTTSSFIAVLKRFIARRGKPLHIYSDNGSNFVGANATLFKFLRSSSDKISSTLSSEGINWHFNPPVAPNFGGLWEAGVKSFKFHLKRILGDSSLTYEDLCTVLVQIEGVLNSRPLSPLSMDPQDPMPLTPAHFLVGRPLTAIPEADHTTVAENRLSKHQRLQAMIQHFWKRWNVEYISELQSRIKWKKSYTKLLVVGSLVIIKEDNVPVCRWKTGRVLELHPGPDAITRVVSVRCADGSVYKRAVSKICVLPVQ